VKAIENAVRLAHKYGLHVNLCLWRAPGYAVTDGSNSEPFNLWTSTTAKDAFYTHWEMWAKRFKDVSPELLSFNLLNEPNVGTSLIPFLLPAANYLTICQNALSRIHAQTPDRIVIADGVDGGRTVSSNLSGLKIAQSVHGWDPPTLTHYDGSGTVPTWPGVVYNGQTWNRARLETYFQPWINLANQGVFVHCGEIGVAASTPHAVLLAFMEDLLDILKQNDIGWALWGFRNGFGLLDASGTDVPFENFNGYRIDRQLLELLQRY